MCLTPQNSQLFMIASVLSWLTLVIFGWMSLAVPDLDKFSDIKTWIFWNYVIIDNDNYNPLIYYPFYPLSIYYVMFYVAGIITLLFVTAAFLVLCIGYFIKKDGNIMSGMLGFLSRFHFVPILSVCALFIIGYTYDDDHGIYDGFNGGHYLFSILFGVAALASLIFIYLRTNLQSPIYATWAIKHGAYGSLIAFLIHHIGYVFSHYGMHDKINDYQDRKDWAKGCYIAFSIIIGLCNIGLSLFLKEIVIPFINLLIYIGMTIQFFEIDKDFRKEFYSEAPGVINIIMMLMSLLMIGFLGSKIKQS